MKFWNFLVPKLMGYVPDESKDYDEFFEVEIETKYPILPFKVHSRLTKAQQMQSGYMELKPNEGTPTPVFKKRNDVFAQVAPIVVSDEAQTNCSYLKNSYIQNECEASRKLHFSKHNSVCNILRVNDTIKLYANDHENLVLNPKSTIRVALPINNDYLCFIDMNLSGKKMISNMCWHPMWTGCVVASYVENAPQLYLESKITSDEVFKAVHDTNPVLFWSFTDDLKPKLILETLRPVYALSSGKCVAISDLKYSHTGCINGIIWMSRFQSVSKTGKVKEVDEGHSLQFLSSSEDGTIRI
ncbi:hypothetical protein BDFB_012968 [Asbolus verrucosus]|uniref:Uncharacterized protein n=1 Tax=Asbolus verrucosus TaxID=1661398 RepID=A0A482VGG5_ASBVE|nr:hypothetical protein BDFB_012968 [Asbolus verrucosus]